MRRREYVTALGGTVGVFATGGTGRAQPATLERVCPADTVTHVRPGDDVLFEAAAEPGVESPDAEWTVDGGESDAVRPGAPFWSYTYRTGNPAAAGRFDETGVYDVTVSVGASSVDWTVVATERAPAAPSADLSCEPGPDATVTVRDEIEVTATAADDSGTLRTLLWQEGRNATYVDDTDLSGADATVTYAVTGGNAIWFIGDYPMIAWIVCRDGRLTTARTEGPAVEAFRDVDISGTNAPVRAGEDLVVEAEIAAEGSSTYHAFVEASADLIVGHDPTHVDSATVEVFAGQAESIELEFTTATVRNTQTFPVRVETRHAASETDVTVIGTDDADERGHLQVTDLETNAPVTGGDRLEVTATLANTGDAPADREVELVVGDNPTTVDTRRVTVDAGATTTVSLGYETYPVRNDDEFPVRVRTGDDSASRTVLVYGRDGDGNGDGNDGDDGTGQASFAVSITGTNAPVAGGERLSVTATVENAGDAAGTHDVELVVGRTPEVVDAASMSLAPGETTTVSLGYETYPVRNDDTFPVTIRSPQTSDTRTVTVRGSG
ncbi:COG1361 family protein [Natrinema salifodinae]|uniref:CARDB protein n=1 Tax=Natrinema salifodinae TaxID=1202768 RepID=A0A1I0M602_9EURY|nr:hypothetical protein [Natrinema salifodinae]SEV82791.1 hypothetical protein SAMN05216285_0409 [Natrinema salifodinae]